MSMNTPTPTPDTTTPVYTMIEVPGSKWNPLNWFTTTIAFVDAAFNDTTFGGYHCYQRGLRPWIRRVLCFEHAHEDTVLYLVYARVSRRKLEQYSDAIDAAYRDMELRNYDPVTFINELIKAAEEDKED